MSSTTADIRRAGSRISVRLIAAVEPRAARLVNHCPERYLVSITNDLIYVKVAGSERGPATFYTVKTTCTEYLRTTRE